MTITHTKPDRDRIQSEGDRYCEDHKLVTGAGDVSLTFKASQQSGAHCRKIYKIEDIVGPLGVVIASNGRSAVLTLAESTTYDSIRVYGRRSS